MSDARPILIHGAGGHAKVAYTVAEASGRTVIGFFDPFAAVSSLFGKPVSPSDPLRRDADAFIAIGDNATRMAAAERIMSGFATLIHPSAIIAPGVEIGEGTLVCAGAILQTGTTIGRHCIVNTGSRIDHDCQIGDFSHIAPGATLCGNVKLQDQVLVGAGATVIPGVELFSRAVLGAGGVALEDIHQGEKWGGVPARYLP